MFFLKSLQFFKSKCNVRLCHNLSPILNSDPIVTILNATTNVGKYLALLLKQSPHIGELRLFDKNPDVCGIGEDLSHIDTQPQVRSYGGVQVLKDAVTNSNIVVTVGGEKVDAAETPQMLFQKNYEDVKLATTHMIKYNPEGFFCIARPPVEAFVPMVSEEYKKGNVYDRRKIFGVLSTEAMRANSIVAKITKENPLEVLCPVVGGLSRESIVGVLSQIRPKGLNLQPIEIQNLIDKAEDDIIQNYQNSGSICLAPALGTSRFINSLLRAIKGDRNCVECCFVRQIGQTEEFLPYMTSIVRLGREGIISTHLPRISGEEGQQLEKAAVKIKEYIQLGEEMVIGKTDNVLRKD